MSQGIVNSFVGVSQLLGQFWSLRPHARSSVQDSHNLMGLLRQEPQSGVPSTFYEYIYIYYKYMCIYIYTRSTLPFHLGDNSPGLCNFFLHETKFR